MSVHTDADKPVYLFHVSPRWVDKCNTSSKKIAIAI